jgi:hypothetical protein
VLEKQTSDSALTLSMIKHGLSPDSFSSNSWWFSSNVSSDLPYLGPSGQPLMSLTLRPVDLQQVIPASGQLQQSKIERELKQGR